MLMGLSKPIADYFAHGNESDAVEKYFTHDAVVTDRGYTHQGVAAIKKWIGEKTTKYSYTTEPFSSEQVGDKTIVASHLVGNFPGSPLDMRYRFGIEDEKIATLEIGV